ncbi:OB-fold nucleic acid binding domain, AA-tRNA synthetase-type [Dillenia turbinata]|uniref:OB-fold nucleic acid binding domain, AA-tRNA synthetase-type n=1 Tax=Dillenia turbinata TaxID=194707 RepID=A0AAN8ZI46_9MAGN
MYSTTQFDGNAAFSGGGFMPSQATQSAADPSFSPAKNRDAQGLLPLTVKQISEALLSSDDKSNILIDGVDVNNVTLVGMILNKTPRVTDVSFKLDDGSGRIDCTRWVNGEASETREMDAVEDGMYVRVHGHLKSFQGKKQLVAFAVRPITDFNEITTHFLECIYVHLCNTKSRLQGGISTQTPMTNPVTNTPSKGYQAPPATEVRVKKFKFHTWRYIPLGLYLSDACFPLQFSGQYSVEGIKGIDQRVLDYMNSIFTEKGIHRDEVAQKLNLPAAKIMYHLSFVTFLHPWEAFKTLEAEGLIYSTIDEWHYKSTANG